MAMEVHQGVDAASHSLALRRPGGYKEMDDVQHLYSYCVKNDDRLALTRVIRTGPTVGNVSFRLVFF